MAIAILVAFGFSSCAVDPYNGGYSNYGGQNVVPAIATGVAIAALAGYANERSSRKRHEQWAYYNRSRNYGGNHGYYPTNHRRGNRCYR